MPAQFEQAVLMTSSRSKMATNARHRQVQQHGVGFSVRQSPLAQASDSGPSAMLHRRQRARSLSLCGGGMLVRHACLFKVRGKLLLQVPNDEPVVGFNARDWLLPQPHGA